MIPNPLIAFLYLFPWYVLLVLIPAIIYMYLRKKFFRKMVQHLIFDNFTKNKYVDAILASTEEEVLFRYFPYAYFKLPGVIVASIIWAILHVPQRESFKTLQLVSTFYYLSAAAFYVYAITVNIFMPLVYHIMHNLICLYLNDLYFKKLEKELKKSKFIKKKEEKPIKGVEYRKVKLKMPYPLEFVKTKTKEIEIEVEEPTTFTYVKVKL